VTVRCVEEAFKARRALARLEFSHPPLGPRRAYEDFFGVPVRFEAKANALVFRSAELRRPLPERDLPTLRFLLAHLEVVRELTMASAPNPELAAILAAVHENADRGEYGLHALAKRLATTPRSLQRRLRGLGTSPRALIEQVRGANAHQLLTDPRLSLSEIAFMLGYSGESSLRRALRRWTGKSPSEIRAEAG
jgi:AraC-like DNA-binding protein